MLKDLASFLTLPGLIELGGVRGLIILLNEANECVYILSMIVDLWSDYTSNKAYNFFSEE